MVLYVLAAEKTSCHNKPFEAIQTSNDSLERNVRYKEAGLLHARSVLKTILVQNFSSMLGFSSLRNLKILGNWHLVTLSSDPLTNLNCSKRFVFRRKLQVSASCRVGIGSDCVLCVVRWIVCCFPILTGGGGLRPACAQVSSKLFSRLGAQI